MAKKKVIIEPPDESPAWLCTFNDLMTLLLTFFVLILSMSSMDDKKVKEMQQDVLNALGLMEAGATPEESIIDKIFDLEEIGKRLKVVKNLFKETYDEEKIEGDVISDEKLIDDFELIKEEGRKQLDKDVKEYVFNQFKEIRDVFYFEPGITVIKQDRGIVLRLQDSMLFAPGKAELQLKKDELLLLERIAAVLKKTELTISVEGHTDSMPIRTLKHQSNWELSVSRAASVVQYLLKTYSVPPEKVSVGGYGDSRPVAANDTEENRRKNRRIDVVLSVS